MMGGFKDTKTADLLRISFHWEGVGNRFHCQLADLPDW